MDLNAACVFSMSRLVALLRFMISSSGQNKNLVIVLSVYAPHVACYGPPESFRGAGQDLLGMIPVSTENQTFSPLGESGVEVTVPKKFAKARVVGMHAPPPR